MVFSKNKMLKRIEAAGMLDQVDNECARIMDLLDGKEVNTHTWNNEVKDEEPRYIITVNGENYPVNSEDCE